MAPPDDTDSTASRPDDLEAQEVLEPEIDDRWGTAPGSGPESTEEGYLFDETAPPTVDGKLNKMGEELRHLTRASFKATLVVGAVLALSDAWNSVGFHNTIGFLVGGLLATINLWILAGGFFAVVDGRVVVPRLLLSVLGSMGVMFGVGLYVVFAHRAWTLGFALGVAVPAAGGVLYAFEKERARARQS